MYITKGTELFKFMIFIYLNVSDWIKIQQEGLKNEENKIWIIQKH